MWAKRISMLSLLLVLLTPKTAHAQWLGPLWHQFTPDDKVMLFGTLAYGTLAAIDARQTIGCIHDYPGRCSEANPVLKPIVESHGAPTAMTVKLSAQAAGVLFTAYWRSKHPDSKMGTTLGMLLQCGLQGAVVLVNRHSINQLK